MPSIGADNPRSARERGVSWIGFRLGGAKNSGARSAGDWLPPGAVEDDAWGVATGSDQAGATGSSGWRRPVCRSGNTGLARKAVDTLLPNSLLGRRALVDSSKAFRRVQPGQAAIRIRTDTIHVGIAGNRTGKDSVPRMTARVVAGQSGGNLLGSPQPIAVGQ